MGPRRAGTGISLATLAQRCGVQLAGHGNVLITIVAPLGDGAPGAIVFLANPKYRGMLAATRASAVIVTPDDAHETSLPKLISNNPHATYAKAAALLYPTAPPAPSVHASASVATTARIAASASIGAGAVIGADVEIGANTTIDRGALGDTVLEDDVKLDNQIQIGRNCRIGGAAMIAGHLEIADGTVISGGTGVFDSIREPGVYTAVFPALPHRDWKHVASVVRRLRRLAERMLALERSNRYSNNDRGE